jgi:serine/threonine-protein kinase
MSPEQARGEKVDQRSDVYALGILAYELLTGRLPFNGDTTVAVLMAHIMAEAPHPSEVCPELSPLFDAPILRMLDKDPTKRPASASDAIQSIRHAAQQAKIELSDAPLRLPRPEPEVSNPPPSFEEADTLLDDVGPSGSPAMARSTTVRSPRTFPRFWVWALLVGVGGLIGMALMSGSPSTKHAASFPEARPSVSVTTATLPSAIASGTTSTAPSTAPSSSAAPSSSVRAQETKRPGAAPGATGGKPKQGTGGKIPTDLENPF